MEIDFIIKIAGVGLIVAILNQVLSRSGREEYAMLTVLAGIIAVIMMIIPQASALLDTVRSTFGF